MLAVGEELRVYGVVCVEVGSSELEGLGSCRWCNARERDASTEWRVAVVVVMMMVVVVVVVVQKEAGVRKGECFGRWCRGEETGPRKESSLVKPSRKQAYVLVEPRPPAQRG